jgi:hypothetical protein
VLEIYRSMLMRITEALAEDVERARAALAQVLGTVTVRDTVEGLWAEMETRPCRQGRVISGVGCGGRIRNPATRAA